MYLDTVLEAVKLEREKTLAKMPKKQQQSTVANGRATHLPAGIGNLATSLADYPPKVSIVSQTRGFGRPRCGEATRLFGGERGA